MPARLGLAGLVARVPASPRGALSAPPLSLLSAVLLFGFVRCTEGRVYAARTVRRADARRFDEPRERMERWL